MTHRHACVRISEQSEIIAQRKRGCSVTNPDILFTSIDALRANVAVLDRHGSIIAVNARWRRYGSQRQAFSDCVGLNYLDVCSDASAGGNASAGKVSAGLRRILDGSAQTFGHLYRCADRIFRMTARQLGAQSGGVIVAHEDITTLLKAKKERDVSRRAMSALEEGYAAQISQAHEEISQRLTAISLARHALEHGGDVGNAVALIALAVDEARHELQALRAL